MGKLQEYIYISTPEFKGEESIQKGEHKQRGELFTCINMVN